MNSLLLRTAGRTASRRAAAASTSASTVRSASVLAGGTAPFSALTSPSPVTTFRGSGFKIAATTTFNFHNTSSGIRHLSSAFLASYDEHVSDRAALADGIGVAPQPLTAGQVAELIDEIKAAKDGDEGADRVRLCRISGNGGVVNKYICPAYLIPA